MKVGIIGTGDVGKALAKGFTASGYEVMMGTRNPAEQKAKDAAASIGKPVALGTFAETAKFGDIVVLATLWGGTENAIKLADPKNIDGKVVIDVTNPLDFSKGAPQLAVGHTDSGGETVQRWLPNSKVVKAFNTVGNAHMFKPQFSQGTPDMFICGNDEDAKKTVSKILNDFGWKDPIDLGGIEGSRYLEPLTMIWVTYGMRYKSWHHAFKMLHD